MMTSNEAIETVKAVWVQMCGWVWIEVREDITQFPQPKPVEPLFRAIPKSLPVDLLELKEIQGLTGSTHHLRRPHSYPIREHMEINALQTRYYLRHKYSNEDGVMLYVFVEERVDINSPFVLQCVREAYESNSPENPR